ncbi:hypothetical protein PR048_020834 [Dryococelus australis]|uniref:Retrovirus-related Pol polyprotein from transposon TNT 1-94-like beta-barrel domain-containing protein n=1 Tax=Dryococelus australis TaxID=614101 RepID=A0ABQ9GWL1_9NEOP|nr:hypothetical protein PR048_020834 [Dryococelus australis]
MNKMEGNVIKLSSESNWKTWKFQTGVTLRAKGVYDVVNGTCVKTEPGSDDYERTLKEWQQNDFLAQDLIITQVDEGPLSHVLTCESAEEIWKKLLTVFERRSELLVHVLQQKFFNLQFLPGEKLKILSVQLGEKLSETMIIIKIPMALPSIYAHFVSAWDSVPVDGRTMGNLIARLLMDEERVLSKTGHLRAQCFRLSLGKNHIRCHFCNKLGHIKRDYYQFKRETQKSESTNVNRDEEAFTVLTSALIGDTCNDYTWFLDTGASELLLVTFGDGRVLKAEGIGSVRLLSVTCESASKIILQNVLFVLEMKINLFSVGSALDKGYTMVSNNHVSKILNSKGKISAIAERAGSLYKMKCSPHESAVAFVGGKTIPSFLA